MIRPSPLQLVLAFAAAASTGMLALEALSPSGEGPAAAAASEQPSAQPPPAAPARGGAGARPRAEPDALYRVVAASPLFEPTRRRREPAAAAPQQASAPVAQAAAIAPLSGSARLVGIVASELRSYAVIQLANAPRAIRVGEGETVQGWTVDRIARDRLILRAGDRQDELKFTSRPRQRN